ncbi:DUF2332 domain-containing protein [Flexibacterium corallicola]|uniref:DUF2332 domain-containing protein n=1 Tax=Flexibacterium corallicola TaxID=3037259 RepID=UPI00286F2430|nr:DUF2332 domain-containing protein [Pseudovibrio sp. M1P-2-3]
MTVLDQALEHGYFAFAAREAKDNSPTYERWANHIAISPEYHEFLVALPEEKRQPNLLFAAIRWAAGRVPEVFELNETLRNHASAIRQEMLRRSTQTNEPGRCAVLLPLLSRLPQPIALIEVGASAGLCLFPDLYAYDYNMNAHQLGQDPAEPDTPVLHCSVTGAAPLPVKRPDVVWRAGLDLNPLDLEDEDAVQWLQTLVWPDQDARLLRLEKAIAVARQHKPRLIKGDLLDDLPALLEQVPSGTTPVVFHSAVLCYVRDTDKRDAFIKMLLGSDVHWISNEGSRVITRFADKVAGPHPSGRFLLCENGEPCAWTGPHGQALEWIG